MTTSKFSFFPLAIISICCGCSKPGSSGSLSPSTPSSSIHHPAEDLSTELTPPLDMGYKPDKDITYLGEIPDPLLANGRSMRLYIGNPTEGSDDWNDGFMLINHCWLKINVVSPKTGYKPSSTRKAMPPVAFGF